MICKNCGKNLPANSIFCGYCGCDLKELDNAKAKTNTRLCPSCGKELPEDMMFCGYCGHNMQDVSIKQKENNETIPMESAAVAVGIADGSGAFEHVEDIKMNDSSNSQNLNELNNAVSNQEETTEGNTSLFGSIKKGFGKAKKGLHDFGVKVQVSNGVACEKCETTIKYKDTKGYKQISYEKIIETGDTFGTNKPVSEQRYYKNIIGKMVVRVNCVCPNCGAKWITEINMQDRIYRHAHNGYGATVEEWSHDFPTNTLIKKYFDEKGWLLARGNKGYYQDVKVM